MAARGILCAIGMSEGELHDVFRGSVALGAIAWIPLVAVAIAERTFGIREGLLEDLSVHARLLVAIPILPVGLALLELRCVSVLERLIEEGYATETVIRPIAERSHRRAHSTAVFVGTLVVAIGLAQAVFWRLLSTPAGDRFVGTGRGPVFAWYAWVGLPIFYFLLLRVVWRWTVWVATLGSLARLPLRTDAAHPDLAGGLAFLARPSTSLGVAVFAGGAVLSSAWGTQVLFHHASLARLSGLVTFWGVLVVVVAIGPLFFFVPQLHRTHRAGRRVYGGFAIRFIRDWRRRWIESRPSIEEPDVRSLHAVQNAFEPVREMKPLPFELRDVLAVVIAAILPMAPLLLAAGSLPDLAVSVLHAFM